MQLDSGRLHSAELHPAELHSGELQERLGVEPEFAASDGGRGRSGPWGGFASSVRSVSGSAEERNQEPSADDGDQRAHRNGTQPIQPMSADFDGGRSSAAHAASLGHRTEASDNSVRMQLCLEWAF